MMWVAGGLAAGLAALFLVLWFAPEDEQTAPQSAGTAKAVRVDAALADQGKQVADSDGCGSCHTTDGSKDVGPSWKGIYGTTAELGDGKTVEVDGVSDEDVQAIVEYIKSLYD
jgi:mono/diheme cytochrome c family protein